MHAKKTKQLLWNCDNYIQSIIIIIILLINNYTGILYLIMNSDQARFHMPIPIDLKVHTGLDNNMCSIYRPVAWTAVSSFFLLSCITQSRICISSFELGTWLMSITSPFTIQTHSVIVFWDEHLKKACHLVSLSTVLIQVVLSMISPTGWGLMRFTENSSSTSNAVSSIIGILMQSIVFVSSEGVNVKSTLVFW